MIESLLSVQNSPEYVRGAIIAKAFNTPDKIALTVENLIESNYPDKQTAFADAIRKAQSFPFIVRYSESGKSYELPVSLEKNTLVIGQRVFTFSNSE